MVASMNFNPTLSKTVIRRTTNLMRDQTKLPEFVSALNSEQTRLTGKKPVDAIKEKTVDAQNSTN